MNESKSGGIYSLKAGRYNTLELAMGALSFMDMYINLHTGSYVLPVY